MLPANHFAKEAKPKDAGRNFATRVAAFAPSGML
jgi:hypothetical protein